jgi:DNA-binding transcriptional MerR regulator
MERESYRLPELADAAGVTPRTVRYYIAQGLLPSPGRLGAGTRYGSDHLDRLHRIRRLRDQGLSLAEIRDRLEPPSTPMLADAGWAPFEPRLAMLRATHAEPMAPVPPPIGRSTWERIALAPDLELHVRRPHADATRRLVDEIKSLVDRRM